MADQLVPEMQAKENVAINIWPAVEEALDNLDQKYKQLGYVFM